MLLVSKNIGSDLILKPLIMQNFIQFTNLQFIYLCSIKLTINIIISSNWSNSLLNMFMTIIRRLNHPYLQIVRLKKKTKSVFKCLKHLPLSHNVPLMVSSDKISAKIITPRRTSIIPIV